MSIFIAMHAFKFSLIFRTYISQVPTGCGQYFEGDTGTIQSFNYGGPYIAGVNYGICTRKEKVPVTLNCLFIVTRICNT